MKINGNIKMVLATLAILAVSAGAWVLYPIVRLSGVELDPIKPGRVTLLAVQPGAGYRIIVANQIASLAEVDEQEIGQNMDTGSDSNVQNARRLPIREFLASLQGDTAALGRLVMSLNDLDEEDLPPVRTIWTAEDIQRALDGDAELRSKLEADLNVTLEGRPLDTLRVGAIVNGIVIESPVQVKVPVEGQITTLEARVLEPFRPAFSRKVEERIAGESAKVDFSSEQIIGVYRDEANKLLAAGGAPEDVASALRARINPSRLQGLAEAPERVLSNAFTVLNEGYLTGATLETLSTDTDEKMFNVSVNVNESGRLRLWKYSVSNQNFNLLWIVDGVAIAAPRITTELRQNQVSITRIRAENLVKEAVDMINELATKGEA